MNNLKAMAMEAEQEDYAAAYLEFRVAAGYLPVSGVFHPRTRHLSAVMTRFIHDPNSTIG